MNDNVTLRVNGVDFGGWLEVEIVAGIERQARDFTLGITRSWPGATDIPRRVRPGDVCEVWIGSDKLLTGYVDATPINYDKDQVSVGVKGRSKSADLVDCAADFGKGQWRSRKIESIANDLAKPYGITVKTEVDTGGAIAEHQIQPGETVYESLSRLLNLRQLLSTDGPDGNLVLVNPGSGGRASTAIELGSNVLSADIGLDYKDVFSTYVCKGQRAGTDLDAAENIAESVSKAVDNNVRRYRLMVITQTGQVDTQMCADRVRYEALYRAAKAIEATYTVQGWRQQDGSLWLPNQLVRVRDGVIGFDDDLLVVEVAYKLSGQGMTTTMKVGPQAGYIPSPEATKKAKAKKAKGDTGWDKNATVVTFPVKTKE
jgi:prophage tail gpP-like protein